MKGQRSHDVSTRAITPIIATVLIIAVTLVAGVAIAGYVFGLFGAGTQTAQVQILSTSVPSGVVAANGVARNGTDVSPSVGIAIFCFSDALHPATQNGTVATLQFTNKGVANTKVIGITFTFGGVTYAASFSGTYPQTGCNLASAGTLTMYLTRVSVATGVSVTAGGQFVGSITLSTGAQIPFTGAFE
jgi:flagellin-like protein